jgi:hypothetical protein
MRVRVRKALDFTLLRPLWEMAPSNAALAMPIASSPSRHKGKSPALAAARLQG